MEGTQQNVRVGVGVIIVKDRKVLLGKRKGSHGAGSWAFPGGHLEWNETVEDCAAREVMEESGIKIKNIKKYIFTNDIFPEEGKHYVTCYVRAEYDSGDLKIMEPHKCDAWEWFEWEHLPESLFIPLQNFVKEGLNPIIDP